MSVVLNPFTGELVLVPPGAETLGTVTSVATGTGLTGGPITSSGTVSLDFIATPQIIYLDAIHGSDSTGTGTHLKPYKTLNFAQSTFSDQSDTKIYYLFLAPGTYSETAWAPKQWVHYFGSGNRDSIIANSGTITYSYGGSVSARHLVMNNLLVSNAFNVTRQVGQSATGLSMTFLGVRFAGTVTFTGSGTTGITDTVEMSNCNANALNFNAVNLNVMQSTKALNTAFTGTGVDTSFGSLISQTVVFSRLANVSASGLVNLLFQNTETNQITISDANANFTGDYSSFPTFALSSSITLSGGATAAQIFKQGIVNRIRNITRTVLTTPDTLNANTDFIVNTNLTTPGPVTLTLPAMVSGATFHEGTRLTISDAKGDAATNNITINRGGTDTFVGGATSYIINKNFGSITIQYDNGIWRIVANQGDVVGPSSGTDNAITRFDGTTGKTVQNSTATIDDSGNISATAFKISSSGFQWDNSQMTTGTDFNWRMLFQNEAASALSIVGNNTSQAFRSMLEIQPNKESNVGLIVQPYNGLGTQTADLQQWNDKTGTVLAEVSPIGVIQAGSGLSAKRVTTAVSYSVLNTDYFIGVTDNTSARTITLPAANVTKSGQMFIIKDEAGTAASANNITIARSSTDTMDGATSITITANYGVCRLYSNGNDAYFTF